MNDLKLIGLDGTKIVMYSSDKFHILPDLNTSLNTIINSDGISSNVKGGVCIGFGAGGSKQVSLEDYNLETIIDNLSYQSSSVETTEEGYTVTTSVKNNTSTDIIVSEVGLFCRGQNNYSSYDPCMLTRNVLETPITIKSNETKTFTITINF
jgi:hypothetical protein